MRVGNTLVSIRIDDSKSNIFIEIQQDVQHHNTIHCGAT